MDEGEQSRAAFRAHEFAAPLLASIDLDLSPPQKPSYVLPPALPSFEPFVAVRAGLESGMRSDERSSFFRKCTFDVDMLAKLLQVRREERGKGEKKVAQTLVACFLIFTHFFSRHSPP